MTNFSYSSSSVFFLVHPFCLSTSNRVLKKLEIALILKSTEILFGEDIP